VLLGNPVLWSWDVLGFARVAGEWMDGLMDFFDWESAVASERVSVGVGVGAGDRPPLERGRRRECWVRRSGPGEPVREVK
jgi:hypothetical protein